MSGAGPGKVVAIIGTGSDEDRAVAVACAEAGARLALGTAARGAEFSMASIANEVWAIGVEQFLHVMDGADAVEVTAFASEVYDRFGGCDAVVLAYADDPEAPFEELALEEWEASLRVNLTGPFLAAQAFSRLMDRDDRGTIVFVAPGPGEGVPSERVAGLAGRMGVRGLAAGLADLEERGVAVVAGTRGEVREILAALTAR